MINLNFFPEEVTWHPPNEILVIIKAFLDILTVVAFVILLVIVLYSRRYPIMERKRTLWPMVGFNVLGFISTTMDAIDEFFWFTPKEFYDVLWKPTRLLLFLFAIILLIVTFYYFYQFSDRLFGEET